ncbi:MAG: glycosyl hydrolase, partial [Gammaproteobacteria bacterium]|nr:glycosyl hydrolase [Gammaproteobacteria bacterium]
MGAEQNGGADARLEARIESLVERMTVEEKIGQMSQVQAAVGSIPEELRSAVAAGRIGSILNEVDVEVVNELQRIAVEDSRLGIPLMMGRDVIHGFRTILPIPLGQAATFNPGLVRKGARMAALEAASTGVNWTFAPMIDISRDARWGRIAESFGEDPY